MENNIKLRSQDGEIVEAKMSYFQRCGALVSPGPFNDTVVIPVPTVSARTLRQIFVWLEHHAVDPNWTVEEVNEMNYVPDWDQGFFQSCGSDVYELVSAANALKIPSLLNMASFYAFLKTFYMKDI